MEAGPFGPGRLVAVVGPSGSGKDSIMRAAQKALGASSGSIVFPKRFVTRAPDSHEDHVPIARDAFREAAEAGAFAFSWEAHGLCYGVPREVDELVSRGRTVVLNVSRSVVPLLRQRYANLTVATITADAGTVARRLAGRGRETAEEIARRLARPGWDAPDPEAVEIDNDGPLATAVERFLSILR